MTKIKPTKLTKGIKVKRLGQTKELLSLCATCKHQPKVQIAPRGNVQVITKRPKSIIAFCEKMHIHTQLFEGEDGKQYNDVADCEGYTAK